MLGFALCGGVADRREFRRRRGEFGRRRRESAGGVERIGQVGASSLAARRRTARRRALRAVARATARVW